MFPNPLSSQSKEVKLCSKSILAASTLWQIAGNKMENAMSIGMVENVYLVTCNLHDYLFLWHWTVAIELAILVYSLVPKERHVRKESHDGSLGLCIGMTLHLVKVLILKRDMSRHTGCFQYIKSSQNLSMILKRGMTIHF